MGSPRASWKEACSMPESRFHQQQHNFADETLIDMKFRVLKIKEKLSLICQYA
jgi:hypothetical protein